MSVGWKGCEDGGYVAVAGDGDAAVAGHGDGGVAKVAGDADFAALVGAFRWFF